MNCTLILITYLCVTLRPSAPSAVKDLFYRRGAESQSYAEIISLVLAHRSLHRCEHLVADASLAQFFQLVCRQIKLHRRLFDAANDRAFRKPCFNQFDDRIVRQALGFFEFR